MLYYYEKLVRENYRFGRMPEGGGPLPYSLCTRVQLTGQPRF